jgi:hypothetical protein
VALLAVALLAVGPALADGEGSVSGVIVNSDGPLPGATVELIGGGDPPAHRGAMTNGQGGYSFAHVAPGTYELSASFAGGSPIKVTGVHVIAGKDTAVAPMNLALETVEVKAKSDDMVKLQTTTSGETFESQKLSDLPTARSYTEVLKIAPGVSAEDSSGGQSVYGATSLESSYIIDGINTTSVESGRPTTNLNFDLIDKIELKTGGYEAEYGGAQGAVVNVTTKSGTNDFAGSLGFFYAPDSLNATPEVNGFGTELPTTDTKEISGTFGGPFIKDKLFFFGAISSTSTSKIADQRFLDLLGNNLRTSRSVAEDTDSSDLYSLKLTWQVNARNRLTTTFFSDPRSQQFRDELGGYGGDYQLDSGGASSSVLWTTIFSKWVLEGQVGTHDESNDTLPTEQIREFDPIGPDRRLSTQSIRVRLSSDPGIPGEPSLKVGPYPYSGSADGTRRFVRGSAEAFYGHHGFKLGAEYETADFNQNLDYGWGTGMALEWAQATSSSSSNPEEIVGVRRCWGDGAGNCLDWEHQIQANASTDSSRFYAQDQWKPSPNLTVNYGLRWEIQDVKDPDGVSLVKIDKNLAPRFGFTWDVVGGGKSKLYLSAGRYYDSVPLQVMSRAFSPRILMTRLFRVKNWAFQDFISSMNGQAGDSANGICATNTPLDDYNVPTCWDFESAQFVNYDPLLPLTEYQDAFHTPDAISPTSHFPRNIRPDVIVNSGSLFRAPIDPDLKGASTDEVQFGYDWEFRKSWIAGFKVIGKRLNDAIEDISLDNGKNYIIANPGGPYTFYVDPANTDLVNPNYVPGSSDPDEQPAFAQRVGCTPGRECTVTNDDLHGIGYSAFPKAIRTFRGLELTVGKSLTKKFWFNFSYLNSRTEGNYRGRYFLETEERDPNLTEAFDVPALMVNAFGLLPQDRKHQVKLYGNYRVTPNFGIGGTYRYSSGTPTSATTDPAGGSTPFFGPIYLLPRGSVGRTPSLQNLDLSLSYDVRDTGKLHMTVLLDVFNALNEQKPVAVDEQFLAIGQPKAFVYGSQIYLVQDGRGEPLDSYLDLTFGDGDGRVTPNEWNAWALSLDGRFGSLAALYDHLRHATVPGYTDGLTGGAALAYPGFATCPDSLPTNPGACPALNSGYGSAKQLEAPRSIRVGIRIAF